MQLWASEFGHLIKSLRTATAIRELCWEPSAAHWPSMKCTRSFWPTVYTIITSAEFKSYSINKVVETKLLFSFSFLCRYYWKHGRENSLPPGISCAFHHVCVVILANHLHKTYEPTQRVPPVTFWQRAVRAWRSERISTGDLEENC